MTADDAIIAAFPKPDPLNAQVRNALLNLLHAGQWAELDLGTVAHLIHRYIEEPPWSLWFGPDEAETLATNLEQTAKRLRAASAALNAAKPHWQRFVDSQEGTHDPLGLDLIGQPQTPPTQAKANAPSDLDLSPAAVLASMARDGDPIPTGFAPLDARLRRGGIPPGRVVSIGGPPFAGKTTVVADIALHASEKIPVFALFSDEGRTQAAVRIGVMMGIPLEKIDDDPAGCSEQLDELMGERSITLRKPDCDVATAEDMFALAQERAPDSPALIILDSIQTIPARRDMDSGSEREAYKEFMKVCRDKASGSGHIVLLTSQSNRASYKSRKAEENSVAIASFSGTAAIEFLSDVAMVMSLPDESSDIVKVEMVKNRLMSHKTRLPKTFFVRYDQANGRMLEVDESERESANSLATRARLKPAMDAIRELLTKGGREMSGGEIERRLKGKGAGTGTSSLRSALRMMEGDGSLTSVYRDGKGGGYSYAIR